MAASNITKEASSVQSNQYARETVESIIVAFILAFLFRAFVAEAFVIPTGSMAPTLMGAHKDLLCNECGVRYQLGASLEYDNSTGRPSGQYVVGGTAAISRAVNAINFDDANQATFSGDRILVSKFDYVLSNPKRWDVIVFKFPGEARMNYIKRLIGLPGEQLMIQEGDIYVRQSDNSPWTIARKPPHKALAMRQPVTDTKYLSSSLLQLDYPSLWQPWNQTGGENGWSVQQNSDGWSADLAATSTPTWLRYFHKELSETEWRDVYEEKKLPNTRPTDSTLVTDYLAYNSFYPTSRRLQVDAADLVSRVNSSDNGLHWVGDLTGEFHVQVKSSSGTLLIQLVEFGIVYELAVDVATGEAKLRAFDGLSTERTAIEGYFNGQSDLVAATNIKGSGKYHLAMANTDEQIYLWVNHRLVKFNQPAEFDSWRLRDASQRRPAWTKQDPLDASPIGIGGQGLDLKVDRARVYRDLYYIATRGSPSEFGSNLSIVERELGIAARMSDAQVVKQVYSNPESWESTRLFSLRQKQQFALSEDQYFPMGDNSAQSSDARMWNENFVEQRFLLGKALLVFWPHTWNAPIPFLPNVQRMGLIR